MCLFLLSWRGNLWLALLGVMVVLAACSSPQARDARVAQALAERGEVVTASDEPASRRRARIRLELALGYLERGQATIALDEVKQAILADPLWAEAYSLRGLIYQRLNEPRLAEDSMVRALQLKPQDGALLHNLAWLLCQQSRWAEAERHFRLALGLPSYVDKAKSWMALGLCQMRAQQPQEAERSLLQAYELEPGNPVTGYNLALLLWRRQDTGRAQFYIRRINQNTDLVNAESLWLGIKIERRLQQRTAMLALVEQLRQRFPQSPEWAAYQKGTFDD